MKLKLLVLQFVVLAGAWIGLSLPSHALQFGMPAVVSTAEIPQNALLSPDQLIALQKVPAKAPLLLQVGSRMMFEQGHIPGSEFAGPAVQPEGINLLRARVAKLPRGKFIVIYCGCCPWNRCPNLGPAFKRLQELGFTNVKVLYLADNLGTDWVAKGYPVERTH